MRAAEPVGALVGDQALSQQAPNLRFVLELIGLPWPAAHDLKADILLQTALFTVTGIHLKGVGIGEEPDILRIGVWAVGQCIGPGPELRGSEQGLQ